MREQTSLSTDRTRRAGGSRKLVAALSAVALAGIGLAAATPASATDSYKAPTFGVGNNPGGIAFTPDGARAVVVTAPPGAIEGNLTTYNATTHAKLWGTTVDGQGANGLAISPDGTMALVAYANGAGNSGGLTVVDLAHNTNLGTITGTDQLWDVAFTPDGSKAYAMDWPANSSTGSVAVVNPATRSVVDYIPVSGIPFDVVFSPDSSLAYVVSAFNGNGAGLITVINVGAGTVQTTIPIGAGSDGIAITPDGSTLFATNSGDAVHPGTVSVVSTSQNKVLSTIANVGVGPFAVKVSPDGSQAWVLNWNGGTVAVIDASSKAVVNRYAVSGGGPWSLVFSPNGKQAWVTIDGDDSHITGSVAVFDVKSARWNPTVARISGTDRYQTSVQVAQKAFPTAAPVVFVATGTGFADALAAAAPAAKLGGPLLLTDPNRLPASVKAEITTLHPSTIYIVGGTGAISTAVEQQLKPLAATVTRVAGTDRFDTARQVINVAFPTSTPMTKVYVATGMNFPDALSASAAAGAAGLPVLLVNGTKSSLDTATTNFLTAHGANAFTVIGGPNVVSAGIATQLGASGPVNRIFGADRYTTSQLINSDAFTSGTAAYFATGTSFADALSGAVLAAVKGSPLYVVNPVCVPDGSEADLAGRGVSAVTLIGGTGALSPAVAAMHNC
ncbi:hypothetical protein G3T36_08955 [Diaminobutyricibacter tongyongensis]|uniref:Cell wall-binding repeat-containing protein n=1 Tax=Leifsonia tongyongensis TaxID=1268043 RepID=A0A6L9XX46_9MICO|nr:cell wall-binding repeat-containing protein [Diaminobutyricibacter tongyongensis]NEN06002.1 hypothetical protein [Diaminobutyricibacter tongyongensis]